MDQIETIGGYRNPERLRFTHCFDAATGCKVCIACGMSREAADKISCPKQHVSIEALAKVSNVPTPVVSGVVGLPNYYHGPPIK
jgi:hypothetical protein